MKKIKKRLNRQRKKSTGRRDLYICQLCGGRVGTVELDKGFAPRLIKCTSPDGICLGVMVSNFGRVAAGEHVTHELFQPKKNTWRDLDDATREYLETGGLLIRSIIPPKPRQTIVFSFQADPTMIYNRKDLLATDAVGEKPLTLGEKGGVTYEAIQKVFRERGINGK